jgi:hypothetical protein
MASSRKPAVRSAAAPVKPATDVKPSARLRAASAAQDATGKAAKGKDQGKGKDKPKAGSRADKSSPAAADKMARPASTDDAPDGGKPKKPKLLRDSFTIPKAEYEVLATLKARAAKAGRPVKKSELLRAGIKALAALPDLAFVSALIAVPPLKTRRAAKA